MGSFGAKLRFVCVCAQQIGSFWCNSGARVCLCREDKPSIAWVFKEFLEFIGNNAYAASQNEVEDGLFAVFLMPWA